MESEPAPDQSAPESQAALDAELRQRLEDDANILSVGRKQLAERTLQLEQRTRELEQRTRELELANEQLEGFSYSVSHDLRAPLRAISGFARILATRYSQCLPDEARHYLDNIVEASGNMGRLIDDLLAYSRLGREAVELRDVSLADVIHHVQRHLRPRIEETAAELSLPATLPVVQGTRTLLMQAFTNLLENALMYRSPERAPRVVITWAEKADLIVVSISDNGIGIAEEHFGRIFEPFQRLHSQESIPGTGVGLAVVRKALGLLGGTVSVQSEVGSGTTFHITLARADGDGGSHSTEHSSNYRLYRTDNPVRGGAR